MLNWTSITRGGSQPLYIYGHRPAVTISKGGQVIVSYSTARFKSGPISYITAPAKPSDINNDGHLR